MFNKQVDVEHYNFLKYVTKERWNSYWHQINETLKLNEKDILVIGCGDGLVINCLKKQGLNVSTFDIDKNLHPDYIGSVTDIQKKLKNKNFPVILCCQVLEHLPFDLFEQIIHQLSEVSNNVILSLPMKYIHFEFVLRIWKIKIIDIFIVKPKKSKKTIFKGEHYWEIGTKNCSRTEIETIIKKYFIITDSYPVRELPYHMFYILKKFTPI